jgi:hypothetical protein
LSRNYDEVEILGTLMMVLAIAGLVFIVLCLGYYVGEKQTEEKYCKTYEYVNLDNNTGYAQSCWGDEGRLVCETTDGTVIQVKQYTPITKCQKHE